MNAAAAGVDAALAAAILAVDPAGLGGAVLRGPPGEPRERWLAALRAALPADAPMRRLPLHATDERLLGGLDLTVTLKSGRRSVQRGLLAEADGGVVVLAMAERVSGATAARVAAVLDTAMVAVERDGITARLPARIGLVALDEGLEADERAPAVLRERLAFHLDLGVLAARDAIETIYDPAAVEAARGRLASVRAGDDVLAALVATAAAVGVDSARGAWLALRVARALAALDSRDAVDHDDAAVAARLVLAPRATRMPAAADEPPAEPEAPPPGEPPAGEESTAEPPPPPASQQQLEDLLVAAARAAIPDGLLERLAEGQRRQRGGAGGRAGQARKSAQRGRPVGTRAGLPERGARLDIVETLRAAAPWQPLRRRAAGAATTRVRVETGDFRIRRFKERSETTTIFLVDASGSAALHRLAEAKGAVELLLADCYVRRDRVAVIAFRGGAAELLLPPTRSLVRAKRSLAGLPGGGGTPLAAAVDAGLALADAVQRRGGTPTLVLLTDGRANVARDGTPGRPRAEADALLAARAVRAAGIATLLIDTAPRPQPGAAQLAAEMHARYLALPYADARMLNSAVRAVAGSAA